MKCGYGLCGNCVVDPLGIRLCTEGPVVANDAGLAKAFSNAEDRLVKSRWLKEDALVKLL
jgi:hypothetical protein